MHAEREGLVLVYNGELYNFDHLRRELEREGASFSTRSDTEVVLRAYAKWGRDCLARFEGMFALAIYDRRTSELLIARDPTGIKPLFYHHSSKGSGLRLRAQVGAGGARGAPPVQPGGAGRTAGSRLSGRTGHVLRGSARTAAGHLAVPVGKGAYHRKVLVMAPGQNRTGTSPRHSRQARARSKRVCCSTLSPMCPWAFS